jgi:hypothetical protein
MKFTFYLILRLFLIWTASLFIVACGSSRSVDHEVFKRPATDILITNTNVLSEDGLSILSNQNLLIKKGKIVSITDKPIEPENFLVVDGKGKFVIPGLIDSHVHLQKSENDLLVYLAHGITYIREMSGTNEHLKWRNEIHAGRVGPSIEVSSEKISSKSGIWGFINDLFYTRINISSKSKAIELAKRLKTDGYSNAKISSDISKPMYLAITKSAKQQKLGVAGHIPNSVSFDEFVGNEHKEIAHIEEIVKILNREFGYFSTANGDNFLEYVTTRSREMAKSLRDNQISVSTTLWYIQSISEQIDNLPTLINRIDLSFTNPERIKQWSPGQNEFEVNHKHLAAWWPIFAKANEIVLTALIENDVIILAGTDAMTTMVIPGFSLHQELEALVENGMREEIALKSATSIPADWMGVRTGRIVKGFDADLIILNANPLDNIKEISNINSVISKGYYYDNKLLEEMLNSIRISYGNESI